MSNIQIPVSEPVYTAAKAVAATLTTGAGVVALFITSVADGSLDWQEGGTLIGAIVTAGATIAAVWGTRNRVKMNESNR